MASVSGGNFDGTVSKAAASVVGSVKTTSAAGIGQQLAAAASQHSLVVGAAAPSAVGAAAAQSTVTFAGTSAGTADKIVATQTTHEAGVTLSFNDGTSLTVLGASHLGHFFSGH